MADSERRPAEDEALDQAPCGWLRTDGDGLIQRVNATFCKWVDYPREELVGVRRLQDLFTIGARIFHQTHWHPLLQMQGSVSEVKLDVVRRDGTLVPMVINAIRRGRDGGVIHDVAAYVAHDRDKYERELLESRRKLHESHLQAEDRALVAEQMMGVVSHDLRNPLSTVSMGATLLLRLGPTPQQQAVLERIQRATERSTRLISDLLDFTQARLSGGLAVQQREFALHDAVHDAVDELAMAFPGRELQHVPAGAARWFGDPDRIGQLVGNLVANAMAYGDATRPVTVSTTTGHDEALVSVHNWGEPIPPTLLPSLFEPLARGHGPTESRSLGLGLYIVDQIARAHGGKVLVSSAAESGTRFTVRLPRSPG